MRNFQGIVFIRTQTYTEIFKSALVYLKDIRFADLIRTNDAFPAKKKKKL